MRALVVIAAVAACNGYDAPEYGVCSADGECGAGEVCSRSGECLSADAIAPPVTLSWTINNAVANNASCASHPVMHLVLISDNGADPSLTLTIACASGAGLVLDRIPRHLLWAADLGPAEVPDPEAVPNNVGWDNELLFDDASDVMFYLVERPAP